MHAYRISVQQSQCSALVMQSEANHAVLTTIPLGVSTMFIKGGRGNSGHTFGCRNSELGFRQQKKRTKTKTTA